MPQFFLIWAMHIEGENNNHLDSKPYEWDQSLIQNWGDIEEKAPKKPIH
jgi:hypothetical protein